MNLSSEKRNQLVLAGLVTAAIIAGIYFGLINAQLKGLKKIAEDKAVATEKLDQIRHANDNKDQIKADLGKAQEALGKQEEDIASGDAYSWMVNFIRKFKAAYNVDIPQFSKVAIADVNLLPKFPYRQVTITISGTAYYEDLGRFVSDFENQHPTARILDLAVEPAVVQNLSEREKLSFRMEIVTLAQASAS